jgi:hypothetical protein
MAIPLTAIGWKGFLGVGSTNALLPFQSFDLTEKDSTIVADDIHGGGNPGQTEPAFASQVNAADGELAYNGSINGNIYAGAGTFGTSFRSFIERATDYTERLEGFSSNFPLILSPGGSTVYKYPGATGDESIHRCVISTFAVNGSTGGLLTWNASMMSTTRAEQAGTPAAASLEFEGTTDLTVNNPVPWHGADFDIGSGIGVSDLKNAITGWQVNVDNQTIKMQTFNRARTARDLYNAQIIVGGNFTYFSEAGSFTTLNKLFGPPGLVLTLGSSSPIVLTIPKVVLDVKPIPSGGPNEIITRNVTFIGLAGAPGSGSINLS